MSYNKANLAKYLQALIENTTADETSFDSTEPQSVLGGAGSRIEISGEDGRRFVGEVPHDSPPTLYTLKDGLVAKNDFVNECLKDRDFATNIGSDALLKHLDELLRQIVPRQERDLDYDEILKKDVLKALRAEVKTWCVRAPIANLRISEEVTVGSVKFIPHNVGIVDNTKMIMNIEGPQDVQRNVSYKAAMLRVVGDFSRQGSAWAVTDVSCHQERVRHAASEQIETAINVIRAFTHVFHSHSIGSAFGLPYELSGGQTGFIAESPTGASIQWDRRGIYAPFELNDGILTQLHEHCCFSELSRIAATSWDDLNSLTRAVRVAFQWLGRSIVAMTTAESFTLCAISLERLLICDGEETTVERFADRLAYLLSTDAEIRKQIHRSAKRLYDVRSKIVHAGFEAVEPQQLQEFEQMAISALIASTKLIGELDNHEALRALLHERKMA